MVTTMQENLLTTQQAATYLNMSKAFLERDRWAGAQIPFVRIGSRSVRYELKTLEEYIKTNTRKSTSDFGS